MIGKRALFWAPDFTAIHSMLFGISDFSVTCHTVFAWDVFQISNHDNKKSTALGTLDILAIQHTIRGI